MNLKALPDVSKRLYRVFWFLASCIKIDLCGTYVQLTKLYAKGKKFNQKIFDLNIFTQRYLFTQKYDILDE